MSRHFPPPLLPGLTALLLLAVPAGAAQGSASPAEPEFIITDRPDFTESTLAVPRRTVQIEAGLTWLRGSDGTKTLNLPETLLRWGVGGKTEVRLGIPDALFQRSPQRITGLSDTYLGFKRELGKYGGFDLAIIPAINLPTGSAGFSTGGVDPEFVVAWARDLGGSWAVSGLIGAAWLRDTGGRNLSPFVTVSVGRPIRGRLSTFLEYAGTFPEHGSDSQLLHHGYLYLLNRNSQIDIHGGFGLVRAAPDFFIGAGYSVRFR